MVAKEFFFKIPLYKFTFYIVLRSMESGKSPAQ